MCILAHSRPLEARWFTCACTYCSLKVMSVCILMHCLRLGHHMSMLICLAAKHPPCRHAPPVSKLPTITPQMPRILRTWRDNASEVAAELEGASPSLIAGAAWPLFLKLCHLTQGAEDSVCSLAASSARMCTSHMTPPCTLRPKSSVHRTRLIQSIAFPAPDCTLTAVCQSLAGTQAAVIGLCRPAHG